MNTFFRILFFGCIALSSYSLTKPLMIGAWVPYWHPETGSESARAHSGMLGQISPFALDVDKHGCIINHMTKKEQTWKELSAHFKSEHKIVIPTVHWGDTQAMHNVLSDRKRRLEHITHIMNCVLENGFDGVNIDYESVCSHDRTFYLAFLEALSKQLHAKKLLLHLTIGGRTSDDTIRIVPPTTKNKKHGHTDIKKHAQKHPHIVHASLSPGKGRIGQRYKKILTRCCDQITVIGYDEWGKPYKHYQDALKDKYYVSLASNLWNEQIIKYALTYIPPHKLVLGVATYGLEFAILHKAEYYYL